MPDPRKTVTLALQGGGSHGAFTWGVLDRLLEEERVELEGISGTSAGAMNAVVLADGMEAGGREGARAALARFWRAVSERGSFGPYRGAGLGPWGGWSPWGVWFDWVSQFLSPYQLNPANVNPLREVLESTVDFRRLRGCTCLQLFLCATNVATNHLRIFSREELTLDAVLASACLPQLFQAVEIDGEPYWDGGYMGNPVLEPLVGHCSSSDIVIVQIDPTRREGVPRTAAEIADRVNEITFNSSLMREIRSIAAITRLVEAGVIQDPRYARTYLHRVAAEEDLAGLGVHSKFDTGWGFLTRLRDLGRRKADAWLAENFEHLGERSTLDLREWDPTRAEPSALFCKV